MSNYSIGEIVHVPVLHGDFIITEINPMGWEHLQQTSYKGHAINDDSSHCYFVESQISHQIIKESNNDL